MPKPLDQPLLPSEQPSVDTEQPSVKAEQPSVDMEQPSVDAEQPSVDMEQPSVKAEQASVDAEQPSVDTEKTAGRLKIVFLIQKTNKKEPNMVARPHQTITAQIADAHQTLTNSLAVTEILDLVSDFSYDAARLNQGLALVTAAQEASEQQTIMAGMQKTATQDFLAAQATARDAYQALAKLARAVYLHDPAQRSALGLDGNAPKATSAFLTSAFTLFDNAASLGTLDEYGYDAAKLTSERAKITAMRAADNVQEIAKGKAQQATVEQEAALAAMNDWVAQYRKVAKIALRGKKQLLEQIGITARTSKTAAQRAASAKAAATRAAKKEQG